MERRALLLYALVNYYAAAQDNYASLRRAARQSYGFGDARYASHPRRAAAGGEDAPRRRRRRRPVQPDAPNVCASRSRSRSTWSATLYCASTIVLAGPTPLAEEASISACARAYGRRRAERCENHRPKTHAETPVVPLAVLCRAQWQSGAVGDRESCWRSMLPHVAAENL